MKLILSKIKTYFGKLDKLLLFMCMGIACFAVFIQYTLYENDISSAVTASQYKTQIIAFIAGLVIAMALAAINYKYLAKLWFIYVPLAMGLTLLLFTPLGIQREGADDIGWLDLGIMTIQPSEILKLAFILSLAVHLSKVEDRMNEPIHFILLCIHGAIPTLLIRQTGDDGSALVFLFIFICMMFAAGLSWKYLVMIAVAIPPAVYVLWNYLMQPHQQKRFQVLWDAQMQDVIHDGIYDTGMHKVSIIAKLSKFDQLKTALNDLGVTGMTVTQVMGCGIQKGTTEKYRGVPVDSTLLPKIKVEVIVSKISVDAVVDAAKKALYTGHIGDGKIFVYNVTRVVKIRTGEEDLAALQDVE